MTKAIEEEICDKGFCIVDNFLCQDDYLRLVSTAKGLYCKGQFRSAKIGQLFDAGHHSTIRNDQICWLEEECSDQAMKRYFSKIHALTKLLNQSLFLSLTSFETHFAIYQPGSFYRKHIDQFAKNKERQISCVYYLNESWQDDYAGQLKLYDHHDQLLANVLPQGNRFICFKSDLPHEVCETKEIRYSIAGWLKTRSSFIMDF